MSAERAATPVSITSFGTWTSGGVAVGGAPLEGDGRRLGGWPQAPALAVIHPRARRPDRASQSLVQLAQVECSPRGAAFDPSTGMVLGTPSGSSVSDADFLAGLDQRGPAFGSPSVFVYTLATAPLGEVSIALGLKGPLLTVSAAAASGLSSVVIAAGWVASGKVPACLCGGIEPTEDGAESISLFLLEPTAGPRRVTSRSTGFEPGAKPQVLRPQRPLLDFARSLATEASFTSEVATAAGFWAKVSVGPAR